MSKKCNLRFPISFNNLKFKSVNNYFSQGSKCLGKSSLNARSLSNFYHPIRSRLQTRENISNGCRVGLLLLSCQATTSKTAGSVWLLRDYFVNRWMVYYQGRRLMADKGARFPNCVRQPRIYDL